MELGECACAAAAVVWEMGMSCATASTESRLQCIGLVDCVNLLFQVFNKFIANDMLFVCSPDTCESS